jgi:predicted AlkP superfamily pyrophosphatase or phosphodiesterase
MDANPPNLITLYFEQVDHAGHLQGPNSGAVEEAVAAIDEHLNSLIKGISKLGAIDKLNIIVVSDHGMAQMSRDRVIFIDEYISLDQVEVVNWSPVLEITPEAGAEQLVFDQLKGAHKNLQVYRKGNTPAYWHFDKNPRITPIVGVADPGWSVSSKAYFGEHPNAYTGGAHGYDPLTPSMQGIFIAAGPGFLPGTRIGPVGSIHLYQLLCELLEITPAPNDGNPEVWDNILQ